MNDIDITTEELQSLIISKCLRANNFAATIDAPDLIKWIERIAALTAWLKQRRQPN